MFFFSVFTPLGFVRLFDVVGQFLIKPQFLHDISEEYFAYALEEQCLRRRLKHTEKSGTFYLNPAPVSLGFNLLVEEEDFKLPDKFVSLKNGELLSGLGERLIVVKKRRKLLGNVSTIFILRNLLSYNTC